MIRTILVLGSFVFSVCAQAEPAVQGDAAHGQELFRDLGCITCHSVSGMGGRSAASLGARAGEVYTPNTMAGAMWSHAATMWQAMDKAGVERPKLSEQQAADLFSFIAGRAGTDKAGDAEAGRKVYEAKFCAECHDSPITGAPSLAGLAGQVTPFWMVAGLWEHGAGMLSQMISKNKEWQRLSTQELGDIIEYLNTRK